MRIQQEKGGKKRKVKKKKTRKRKIEKVRKMTILNEHCLYLWSQRIKARGRNTEIENRERGRRRRSCLKEGM